MQKARRHSYCRAPTACRRTVSGTISLPCSGCFSPFPYGTGSLSVSEEYLALPDGAGRFEQDFSGPALLRIPLVLINFCLRGYHPLWPDFPDRSARDAAKTRWLFRFRSPLLSESRLMSFPPGTEIFQFPGFASPHYGFM